MIIEITTVDELELLIQKSNYLVLDFYADWCKPCKKLGTLLDEIKDRDVYKNIVFCKLNVDDEKFSDVCIKFDIESLPTLILFKNSNVEKVIKGLNENEIINSLNSLL